MDLKTYFEKTDVKQTDLARRIGVTPGMVWQWVHSHRQIAAENVLTIEKETGGKVSRHDLRPDLYPRERAHAAKGR